MTDDKNVRQVMTVPEAGAALGLSRNGAYEAARRGFLPTIRVGHRILVPLVAFNRLLNDAGRKPGAA